MLHSRMALTTRQCTQLHHLTRLCMQPGRCSGLLTVLLPSAAQQMQVALLLLLRWAGLQQRTMLQRRRWTATARLCS
jgi:hypothetical protein